MCIDQGSNYQIVNAGLCSMELFIFINLWWCADLDV